MDTPILGRRVVGRKLAATTGLIAALLVTPPQAGRRSSRRCSAPQTTTNGETVGTGTFASNPSGDPAPFDRLIGDKTNGPNPSTSFTFSGYGGPIASPISSATLEFGLYDGASRRRVGAQRPSETSLSVRPVTFLSVIYTASALKPVFWKIIGGGKYYNQ